MDDADNSPRRYLLGAAAAALLVLGGAWAYVLAAPMAFLEAGYPAWVAKATMLRECRLGEVAFFGDSRVEAGVVPALLPVEASNFAVAAGTAVETESAVRRTLQCPVPPKLAVLSISPRQFGPLGRFFWLNTLRYGFLSFADLRRVHATAAEVDDEAALTAARTPDGLSGPVRDWLYAVRFPSLSFSSLVQGRVMGRLDANRARLAGVLADRGWSAYEGSGGVDPAEEGPAEPPGRLQAASLERTLRLLRERGVPVRLLLMPAPEGRDPARDEPFLAYWRTLPTRVPGVELINAAPPRWPAAAFVDGAHLGPDAARRFTARLAACMDGASVRAGCRLD